MKKLVSIILCCVMLVSAFSLTSCDFNITTDNPSANNTYTVTFLNYDNSLLYRANDIKEGDPAIYAGEAPTRPASEEYTYTFSGWDKELSAIYSDLAVFAQYTKVPKNGKTPDADNNQQGENNNQNGNQGSGDNSEIDNIGQSMVIDAYNAENQPNNLGLYTVGNFGNEFLVFYFDLGLIKKTPIYTSAALEYGNQDINLNIKFSKLTEEGLENAISQATEIIDTHSQNTGINAGINFGFEKNASFKNEILAIGAKSNFSIAVSSDVQWTNNWGSISTNSSSIKNSYINTYSEGYELNLNISENMGFKRGYSYRVSFYETVQCYGVLYYDLETKEYTIAYENLLVPNQTRMVLEESTDTNGTFNYNFNKTITFDIDQAIQIASQNMPKPTQYTVVYNANGGTGSMDQTTHSYGQISKLSTNKFTRSGYTFKGWATQPNGTEATYGNGASISKPTLDSTNKVTLYAIWTLNTKETCYLNTDKTIDDSDGVYERVYTKLDYQALRTQGYKSIDLFFTVSGKEVDDGDQRVWVAFNDQTIRDFTHVSSSGATSITFTFTATISLEPNINVGAIEILVEFGAESTHWFGGNDEWIKTDCSIEITAKK